MEDTEDRSFSVAEEAGKNELIENVKSEIIEGGLQRHIKISIAENYKLTVSNDRKELKMSKRGTAELKTKTSTALTASGTKSGISMSAS